MNFKITHLLFILVLSLFSVFTQAQGDLITGFVLNPDSVEEGQEFKLSLKSFRYTCGTTFSELKVQVDNNKIYLTYLPMNDLDVLCPLVLMPYGPTYDITALTPGQYEIYAVILPDCYPCELTPKTVLAETLTVTAKEERAWSITPDTMAENKAFNLRILNSKYNDCNYAFSRVRAEINDKDITLSFVNTEIMTFILCKDIVSPWGPSVDIKGLEKGNYNVYVVEEPACMYDSLRPCTVKLMRQEAGTLEITGKPESWFIEPEQAIAETKFNLSLLNYNYDTCQTSITNDSVFIHENNISLTFSMITNTKRLCPEITEPFFHSFPITPLQEGKYTVYATEIPACTFDIPPCLLERPLPVEAGILTVIDGSVSFQPFDHDTRQIFLTSHKSGVTVFTPDHFEGTVILTIYSLKGKEIYQSAPIHSSNGRPLVYTSIPILEHSVYTIKVLTESKTNTKISNFLMKK
ncbi:MAG: hypothetical protein HQK83_19785 [Fibrobacteria bacterium]|nr:hypothetical protein [Fibrobacteria bacterium]